MISSVRQLSGMVASTFLMMLMTAPAHAALVTSSDTHALAPTTWLDTFTVSQFNPAQGTLNSVKATFEADLLYDIIFDNDTTGFATAGATVTLNFGSFEIGGILLGGAEVRDGVGGDVLSPDTSGIPDSPGDGGPDEVSFPNNMKSDSVIVSSPAFDTTPFIGTGTISSTAFGPVVSVSNVPLGVDHLVSSSQAGATLTVEYDFTPAPVPIPGAALLFGSGLAGLIGLRGWRKKTV